MDINISEANQFIKLHAQPQGVNSNDLGLINDWISEYPYCQTLHVLATQAVKNNSNSEDYLAKAATFSSNREVLFQFINHFEDFESEAITLDADVNVANETTEVIEPNRDMGEAFGADLNYYKVAEKEDFTEPVTPELLVLEEEPVQEEEYIEAEEVSEEAVSDLKEVVEEEPVQEEEDVEETVAEDVVEEPITDEEGSVQEEQIEDVVAEETVEEPITVADELVEEERVQEDKHIEEPVAGKKAEESIAVADEAVEKEESVQEEQAEEVRTEEKVEEPIAVAEEIPVQEEEQIDRFVEEERISQENTEEALAEETQEGPVQEEQAEEVIAEEKVDEPIAVAEETPVQEEEQIDRFVEEEETAQENIEEVVAEETQEELVEEENHIEDVVEGEAPAEPIAVADEAVEKEESVQEEQAEEVRTEEKVEEPIAVSEEEVFEEEQKDRFVEEEETPQENIEEAVGEELKEDNVEQVVAEETLEEQPIKEEENATASSTEEPTKKEELIFDSPVASDFFAFAKAEKPAAVVENTNVQAVVAPQNSNKKTTEDVSQYNDSSLPYTFLWWLNKTRKEHASNTQPYVKVAKPVAEVKQKPIEQSLNHQIAENIFHLRGVDEIDSNTTRNQTVPFDFRKKEFTIIEKFIKEEPQIKPPAANKIDTENKAKKSSEDANQVVSETLAKIYVEQMLYHKALDVYKKLSLKYPEKSTYFASQIKYLELKVN